MGSQSSLGKDKEYLEICQVLVGDESVLSEKCLTCSTGVSCRSCRQKKLLGSRADARAELVLYSSESGENKKRNNQQSLHKRARYMVRADAGVFCGFLGGYRFRWFVLTESDEALRAGLDFNLEFHRFIRWLRYYCPDFQYQVVEHRQGARSVVTGEPRLNRHILSYGSDKLPLEAIEDYWSKRYLSRVTGMAEVHSLEKSIQYLAGYLGSGEKFVRAWSSQGWVFKGWLSFSRAFKSKWDEYPARHIFVYLRNLSYSNRIAEIEFLLETGCRSCEVLK